MSALLEARETSIRFRHEMRNVESGEIVAICELTRVRLDRPTRKGTFADTIRKAVTMRVAELAIG